MNRTYIKILVFFLYLGCFYPANSQVLFDTVSLKSKAAFNYTTKLNFDKNNNLWLSSHRGLYLINGYTAKYFVFNPNDSSSILSNRVYDTYFDDQERLWVGTSKGVQIMDLEKLIANSLVDDYVNKTESLYATSFNTFQQLDNDSYLIGTKKGALLYNIETKHFEFFPIVEDAWEDGYSSETHVIGITADPKNPNIFYLLTRGGIYKYDKSSNKFTLFSKGQKSLFKEITIPGLRSEIKNNCLVFISRYQLVKYNLETHEVTRFNLNGREQGLQIRDFRFKNDSTILISYSAHGLVELNFYDFKQHSTVTKGLFNKIGIDKNGYLWSILETKYLLKSKKPYVESSFSGCHVSIDNYWINDILVPKSKLYENEVFVQQNFERDVNLEVSYSNPEDVNTIEYEYQLLPVSKKWMPVPKSRKLSLPELTPKNYKLTIKAIDKNGNECLSDTLRFKVNAYFYELWWFKALIFFCVFFFIATIYYLIQSRKRERAKHLKELLELELNTLRSQMNPHFLFNTLNSIKNYVLSKDPLAASQYLTKFSKLIRNILENSKQPLLSLEQEIDTIKLYVEIEHLRFDEDFNYSITVDENIDSSTFYVAPMLIQPYVENAIWHGLRHKKGNRELLIRFAESSGGILCTIADNGIGREASKKLQQNSLNKNKSLGMNITNDRIRNINLLYNINAHIEISDNSPSGTLVNMFLPDIDINKISKS